MNELIGKHVSSVSSSINIAQIPPIHQKRLLTFVNHFIITTINFLNNFAQTCEKKLLSCEQKMQKLEAALSILEAKLNSIPGLEDVQTTNLVQRNPAGDKIDKPPDEIIYSIIPTTQEELPANAEKTENESTTVNKTNNPELSRFQKMVQVGVPVPAVKLKMEQEGFDPNLLDS